MIALICDKKQEEWMMTLLSEFDEVCLYTDGTALAYYLVAGNHCRLAVVAKDCAEGMNDCSYIGKRKTLGAVLWITEQATFLNQSKRMGIAGFMVKPVCSMLVREMVQKLLLEGDSRLLQNE